MPAGFTSPVIRGSTRSYGVIAKDRCNSAMTHAIVSRRRLAHPALGRRPLGQFLLRLTNSRAKKGWAQSAHPFLLFSAFSYFRVLLCQSSRFPIKRAGLAKRR